LKGKFAPFDLKTGPIGVFPSWKRPRVIWAGVEDPEGSISELAGYIENIMADLGFKKEERAYVPHLTLGRVRGRVDVRKLKTLAEGIDPPAEGHRINKIDLIMSELLPGGARYTVIEEIELG
jgi:2'-5' RNA ligase